MEQPVSFQPELESKDPPKHWTVYDVIWNLDNTNSVIQHSYDTRHFAEKVFYVRGFLCK